MKKVLLTLFAALLMPALALAQTNMGISKTHNTYSNYTTGGNTETQVTVPYRVAVGHDMPAEQDDSYSVGAWFKLTAWPSTTQSNAATYDRACIMRLGTTDHLNHNGNFAISVLKNSGQIHIVGHGGDNQGGAQTAGIKFNGTIDAGIQLNQWYHMVLSVDNANNRIALYLNGENIKEVAITTPLVYGGTTGWSDGVFGFADFCFSGVLDEVQFWNHGLSDSDVLRAYKNASDVEGLTGLYTFSTAAISWPNEAPNAMEGTDAVYNIYTGTFLDGGITSCSHAQATTAPTLVDGRENFCTLTIDAPEGVTATISQGTSVIADLSTIVIGKEYYATFSVPAGKCVSSVKIGETVLTEQGGKYSFTLDGDATLTVELADAQMYTVNIVQPANGTISASYVDGTSTVSVQSGASLSEGTVLTLSNTPATGYSLVNYTINGTPYNTSAYTLKGDITISGVFDEHIEYCEPTGTSSDRYLTSFTVVDSDNNSMTMTAETDDQKHNYYNLSAESDVAEKDKKIFETKAGNTLTFTFEGNGNWCHRYVWIDYGRDGSFDVDVNATSPNQDLAAFDRWSPANNPSTYYDKDGNSVSSGNPGGCNAQTLTVVLPADMAPGTYRLRVRQGYNDRDACKSLNDSGTESGRSCFDASIRIISTDLETPRAVTVAAANEAYGTVAITNPATEGASVETTQANVTIAATAAEGYAFMSWTDADGNVVSDDAVYTYTGTTDATFTANFGVIVTIVAAENGSVSVMTADDAAVNNGDVLPVGAEITVMATPAEGYELEVIVINEEDFDESPANYTIAGPTQIAATFAKVTYTLSISVTGPGHVKIYDYMMENDEDAPAEATEYVNGSEISYNQFLYVHLIPNEGGQLQSCTITNVFGVDGNTYISYPENDNGMFYKGSEMGYDAKYIVGFATSAGGNMEITAVFSQDPSTAIDGIYADGFDENAPVEYYNLQGVRVAAENLAPGFYIARQGAKAKKVLVTK